MCNQRCHTARCKNKATNGRFCYTCVARKYRAANPERACFNTLKDNAKRRGKEFTITFAFFKKFCRKTDYIAGRGRSKDCYTIDRIDNEKGYIPGNIQMLTKHDNCVKGTKVLNYDYRTGYAVVVDRIRAVKPDLSTNPQYVF